MGGGQEQGTEQLAQGPALPLRVGMNRILILCSGNYYRSRFAEEVLNSRARAVCCNWIADSRGLRLNPNNVGPIAEVALRRLEVLGVQPLQAHRLPEMVTETDFENSSIVIAMSREEHHPLMRKLFPAYADRICYWDIEDTGEMPPDVALQKIESLVNQLIEDVSSRHRNR